MNLSGKSLETSRKTERLELPAIHLLPHPPHTAAARCKRNHQGLVAVSHSCGRRSNIRSASIRCAFPQEKKAHRHEQRLMPGTLFCYLDLSPLRHPPTKGLQVFVFPFLCGSTATLTKHDSVKMFFPSVSFSFCLTVLVHFRLLLVKQTAFFSSSGIWPAVIGFHDSLKRPLPSYSR